MEILSRWEIFGVGMEIGQVQALVFPEGAAPPQTPPKRIAAGASRPGDVIGATNRFIYIKIEVRVGQKWTMLTGPWMVVVRCRRQGVKVCSTY